MIKQINWTSFSGLLYLTLKVGHLTWPAGSKCESADARSVIGVYIRQYIRSDSSSSDQADTIVDFAGRGRRAAQRYESFASLRIASPDS